MRRSARFARVLFDSPAAWVSRCIFPFSDPLVGGHLHFTRAIVILTSLFSTSVLAQDADSDRLRALTKSLPQLRFDRVELKTIPSRTFEGISAVTVDGHGNIYVLHRPVNGDPVIVLDSRGHVLRSWGAGMFTIPHGIRVDPAGNVWTVDAHTSMVYKFTPQGRKLLEINVGGVPDTVKEFCGASDVAFGPHGRVFVADGYCNARVIEFDARGKKVREWGRPGSGPGEFKVLHSIAVGPDGFLYVADRENGRLQWFDLDGKFLGQWRSGGQLFSVAFGAGGEVFVGTHPKGVPPDDEFNVLRIDPVGGEIFGRIAVRAHELAVGPDGSLFPATRSGQLLLLRPAPVGAFARARPAINGDSSELVGTWRLVEFWDRDSAAAPKRYRYGERPTGYFVYDPTGHVSIQILSGPAHPVIARERGEDWFQTASLDELRAVVENFRAYFGTYSVDRERGVVVHHVEGDSRALYTGSPQRRQFRLVGDSLIIGNDTTARRVLLRVR